MALYKIEWKHSAKKELKKLEKSVIRKIIKTVEGLGENPYPQGCKKLKNAEHTFRIRFGDYRVVYSIQSNRLVVEVIRVCHRKDVYEKIT